MRGSAESRLWVQMVVKGYPKTRIGFKSLAAFQRKRMTARFGLHYLRQQPRYAASTEGRALGMLGRMIRIRWRFWLRVVGPIVGLAVAGLSMLAACDRDATRPSPAATPVASETPTTQPPDVHITPTSQQHPPPPADHIPSRDLVDLAIRLRKLPPGSVPQPRTFPKAQSVGDIEVFSVSDQVANRLLRVEASLELITRHVYWYVDTTQTLPEGALEGVARRFEEEIRPAIVAAIGDIRSPGIDGDPRLTVLTTRLNGLAGYFGAGDLYPKAVHPESNEREMMYMDVLALRGNPDEFLAVLAHEFQHAVHSNLDADEESWVNEGLSELARELTTSPSIFVSFFAQTPSTQLTWWPGGAGSAANYGASAIFLDYLFDRYGGPEGYGRLARIEADGVRGVEEYLAGYGVAFDDLFADWIIANLLDLPEGPYAHLDRAFTIRRIEGIAPGAETEHSTPQYAAGYYRVRLEGDQVTVRFTGDTEAGQVAARCHSGERCWWGNIGDAKNARLTRAFDLRGLEAATLDYWVWHDIEDGWDYAYVTISGDEGETWDILDGVHTTARNPVGNAFGPGYTGQSAEWVNERIDLSAYAGKQVLVRFEYVTDDAVYF
ncbi:MAG: hypothetical protein FJ317_05320, partial [SAR202 cluster bacterium]|nr:hypothetical protein [SAR202 cluster bacterium]